MIELMVVDLTLLYSTQKLNNFYALKHPRMVKNCGKGPNETKNKFIEPLQEKLDGMTTVINIVID